MQLFIDGNWQDGSLQKTKKVENPATGESVAQVAQAETEDTTRAIEAAQTAFPRWRELELQSRVELLHRVAHLLEEKADKLAKIMTIEQGKPLAEAKSEILTGAENFRFNAEEARRIYGETIPAPNKHVYIVKKEPIGVVAAITPWNFPMGMATRKLAPALAAGNTVILKPSSETPLSALALFEIFEEAGFPRGVVNLLLGNSSEIGKALTASDIVRKLTFTGSTAVGQKLYQESGETLKKISLELGGHAPFIVFSDANLESAADGLVAAKFRNNGQVCVSPNRIFVAKEIEQEFTKLVLERVRNLQVGNGLREGVNVGPLIREDAIHKINRQLKDAAEKGADILIGGERLLDGEGNEKGNFYAPTVLTGVTEQMRIFHEETFGPVIPIISFVSDDEVVKLANDSEFGLASYFYTESLERVEEISNALEYGMVGVNDIAISHPETPFGGVKHSGFGRENGHFGIEEYLNVKFVALKYRT
ncbi:NAD-dependent succinate-semialdehyde dehydrogenase [Listeria kieliensis]|uniref:Aldehyde dehydrogenase n=1 Tax=Listeria kieliensis TaxID=1621700 RepID=A0A3D8TVG5_9LIST|nr:NAD-dependent succinate-semialdehyde dehydrogenase [Listeria kieliensis]RDX02993.1 succinate-semialdehyde dehydrogenase [Listeria kieliensis]